MLEKCIKTVITTSPENEDAECPLANRNTCKTFVVSTYLRGAGSTAVRMRTYGTLNADPFDAKVWEAARATSAALTFFKEMVIADVKYGDGGTGWNNPTDEVIDEAHRIWPNRQIGCLVSLGTGLEDAIQLRDSSGKVTEGFMQALFQRTMPARAFKVRVAEYCVKSLTSCEKVHQEIARNPNRYGLSESYFRLNVPQGMSKIGLEEWEKLGDLAALTHSYMDSGELLAIKQRIAKILLHPRTAKKAQGKDPLGRTALHRAALRGDTKEIIAQIAQEADIDETEDINGWTPLMCSMMSGHESAMRTLLHEGADVNKPDKHGWTPLHKCASGRTQDPLAAWILLEEYNADVHCRDDNRRTPLHHAALGGSLVIVEMLVTRGADVNAKDMRGATPVHFAELLQAIDVMKYLKSKGADINAKDNTGLTPLHWAAAHGSEMVVDWLLGAGADVDAIDLHGRKALQLAEKNAMTTIAQKLRGEASAGESSAAYDRLEEGSTREHSKLKYLDLVNVDCLQEK